jgi:hypothetical protein
MNECHQMRHTIVGIDRPRSLVQGGYTSQVARIQSQLITSWVGDGETTANCLPISPHRSFESVDATVRTAVVQVLCNRCTW